VYLIAILAIYILSLLSLTTAQEKISLNVITTEINPGENVSLKIELYDSQNKPLDDLVQISIENLQKIQTFQGNFSSNKFFDIPIGEDAEFGFWTINAVYKESKASDKFLVKSNELAQFNLEKDILTITNTGNTRYVKTIQILIGDTPKEIEVDLYPGEKTSFRLMAKDGEYNVRISDGTTTLTKSSVSLTGNAIGISDQNTAESDNPITSGSSPNLDNVEKPKTKNFIYIFIVAIFGTALLLLLERKYKKKARHNI